jgi:hypothetical protein
MQIELISPPLRDEDGNITGPAPAPVLMGDIDVAPRIAKEERTEPVGPTPHISGLT